MYHNLLTGDCLEIIPTLNLAGVITITDPPYPNKSGHMTDMVKTSAKAFHMIRDVNTCAMLWFWNTISDPPFEEPIVSRHVWHKTNGWQAGNWESINVYGNYTKAGHVFSFPNVNVPGTPRREDLGNHPTPKPIPLMKALVLEHTKKGDIVFDPFMGVGATAVACAQTGRDFIGIDINPDYVKVTRRRIEKELRQIRMGL
jgi:DNA modification methylase